MPNATIINKFGKLTGWNAITLNIYGRDVEGFTEVEYTDEQVMESEHGQGKYPMGYSEGNYTSKASITLYSEELLAITRSLPKGVRLQEIPPVPMVVQYENEGTVYKDVVQGVKFKNNGRSVKQGDGKIVHKIDLLISHIDWNA